MLECLYSPFEAFDVYIAYIFGVGVRRPQLTSFKISLGFPSGDGL